MKRSMVYLGEGATIEVVGAIRPMVDALWAMRDDPIPTEGGLYEITLPEALEPKTLGP